MSATRYKIAIRINWGIISSPFLLDCIGKIQISICLSLNCYIISGDKNHMKWLITSDIYNLPALYSTLVISCTIRVIE